MMDIQTSDCGAIVLLIGETAAGLAWLQENLCTEPWQWLGPSIAIEPRAVADILAGARDDGMEVAA
jgi:hypothetical protein